MSWLFPGGTTIVGSPITIGTTTVLPPGANASVTNTGTAYAPVLNFGIPPVANVEGTISGAASTVVTHDLAGNIVVVSDAAGKIANSAVTVTQLGYLIGATSNVQAQLDAKQITVTGAASTVTVSNLAPNVVVVTNAAGKLSNNAVTVAELGYLAGATSNVQAQLDAKQIILTGAASTVTVSNLAPNVVVVTNAAGKLSNNAVTITELGYLAGATSNVQAQLNTKRYAYPSVVDVATIADLPTAVADVITLPDNASYRIIGDLDLAGARLVTGDNTSIVGQAPYYSTLRSTGISTAVPMITAAQGFQIDSLNLIAPTIFSATGNSTSLFGFWRSTFTASRQIGNIREAGLVTLNTCTSSPSGNISFQGNIEAVTIQSCTMKGLGTGTAMFYLDPTLRVTGRMRMFMNNFDPGAGGTGIVVANTANIIRAEGLWLDSNAFEDGTSTSLTGIDVTTSNYIVAFNNVNLASSLAAGQVYLTAPSSIPTANVALYYKMTGTYALGANSTKFASDGTGRATYVGSLNVRTQVVASLTFTTNKNLDICSFGIYDSMRGNVAPESVHSMTSGSTSQPQNVTIVYVATMAPGTYLEVWGRNQSTAGGAINLENVTMSVDGR